MSTSPSQTIRLLVGLVVLLAALCGALAAALVLSAGCRPIALRIFGASGLSPAFPGTRYEETERA